MSHDHFESLGDFSIDDVKLSCWRSKLTNVRIYSVGVVSPLVAGYFTLPTEAHDNNGCPHVLEHMIFLGSRDYPTKGVLDSLANRCLAQGTNAWTSTDHTTYSLTTAGQEGFLNLLPIYLDHILRPTLKSDQFLTEVHHFTESGASNGVVYCEMEGREFEDIAVVGRAAGRWLYPGDCGYQFETGGLLENLRSLDIETVRDYHKKFYCWNNLSIIVSGPCDPQALLDAIAKVELHQTQSMSPEELHRLQTPAVHWDSPIPKFIAPARPITAEFPCDEEGTGMLAICWRSTDLWSNFEENLALEILSTYLTESNVAPLHVALVEAAAPWAPDGVDAPLCSSLEFLSEAFVHPYIELSLSDVQVDAMDKAGKAVRDVFRLVHSLPLDMLRMRQLVQRSLAQMRRMLEVKPHELVSEWLIEFVVNGRGCMHTLNKLLEAEETHARLERMDSKYWLDLLKAQFIDSPYVEVHGVASPGLAKKIQKNDKIRRQKIKRDQGNKLKEIAKSVAVVRKENAAGPGPEIEALVPVASAANVPIFEFPEITNYFSVCPEELSSSPFPIQFQTIEISKFVLIRVMVRIPDGDDDYKLMVPLLADLIFSCPTKLMDGREISHEEFTNMLSATTTAHHATVGLEGSDFRPAVCPEIVCVLAVAPYEQASDLVMLLNGAIYGQTITADRVTALAQSSLGACAKRRRSGDFLLDQMESSLLFKRSSMYNAGGLARQQNFLRRLLRDVDSFVPKLQNAYHKLFAGPERRMMIQVAAAVHRLPTDFVKSIVIERLCRPELPAVRFDRSCKPNEYLNVTHSLESQIGEKELPFGPEVILGLASSDSSYITISVEGGPLGEDHPDLPALLVLMEHMGALEGPIYRAVRGCGSSYHFELGFETDTAKMFLNLGPGSSIVKAVHLCRKSIAKFLAATGPVEHLDAAKAAAVFGIVSKEDSLSGYAYQSILMTLRGVDSNHHRTLLSQVAMVGSEDVRRVAAKYLPPLLGSGGRVAAVTNSSKVGEFVEESESRLGMKFEGLANVDEFIKRADGGMWEKSLSNEADFKEQKKKQGSGDDDAESSDDEESEEGSDDDGSSDEWEDEESETQSDRKKKRKY